MLSSMHKSFDFVIIGAGPAAVAALSAAPSENRICIVTGIGSPPVRNDMRVHPKIRAVSFERSEVPGFSDFLPFEGRNKAGLFSTAAIGGLANYWGQQFVRYGEGDPWPSDIFDGYCHYERACFDVEAMFAITPTLDSKSEHAENGHYIARKPRLIVGTAKHPQCGLYAMREAFQDLALSRKVQTMSLRAISWKLDGGGVSVLLSNGERVRGNCLVLAAGVLGTLRLCMESCPELAGAQFSDLAPYMLYTLGRDPVLAEQLADGRDHFNTLSLEKIERGRCCLFASFYRMSRASLSLLLSAAGLPLYLRGWRAPRIADTVRPVQVWTQISKVQYRLARKSQTAVSVEAANPDTDKALDSFVNWLKSRSVVMRTVKLDSAFHYHRSEVTVDGISFTRLSRHIEDRFKGRVICVDASILEDVSCRPHTLTAMASARELFGQKTG